MLSDFGLFQHIMGGNFNKDKNKFRILKMIDVQHFNIEQQPHTDTHLQNLADKRNIKLLWSDLSEDLYQKIN